MCEMKKKWMMLIAFCFLLQLAFLLLSKDNGVLVVLLRSRDIDFRGVQKKEMMTLEALLLLHATVKLGFSTLYWMRRCTVVVNFD